MAREGFSVVVNLALHNDHYSLRDETGLVQSLGMEYIHIPVAFDAPKETDLLAFFEAMEKYQSRQKIFIHCAANMRVSAFLGLYRAIKNGESTDQAFALMRTLWEPNPVWSSFISSMLTKYRG